MQRVLIAELAELAEFNTVGVVLLVLHSIVIPLFALTARKCNLHPHFDCPPSK